MLVVVVGVAVMLNLWCSWDAKWLEVVVVLSRRAGGKDRAGCRWA